MGACVGVMWIIGVLMSFWNPLGLRGPGVLDYRSASRFHGERLFLRHSRSPLHERPLRSSNVWEDFGLSLVRICGENPDAHDAEGAGELPLWFFPRPEHVYTRSALNRCSESQRPALCRLGLSWRAALS